MNRAVKVALVATLLGSSASFFSAAWAAEPVVLLAQAGEQAPKSNDAPAQDEPPEAKMARRFPQKVRVGDLVGLPMLDGNDITLGKVQGVVRTPEGKIRLVVGYSKWFGLFGRPVAVPIEVVAILARQIASLDMQPDEYERAPTWVQGSDRAIAENDIIRIAVTRR